MSVTMQDIYARRRMCSEKSRFATEIEAKVFILKKKAELRAYQCPHCNDWHLTKRLTPPCAIEGGSMSYTPPLGRPISTPPMPNGADVVKPIFGQHVKSSAWYETRKSRAFKAKFSRALKAAAAKHERMAKAEVQRLNRGETRGVWMTQHQYMRAAGVSVDTASMRYRSKGWEFKRLKGPKTVFLVPHDCVPQPKPKVETIAPIEFVTAVTEVAPPKPTLWQRIVGWFK